MAAGSTNAWPDVLTPLPTRFIHGATNRHPTDVDQLKTTLLQNANFVWRFEPFEDDCHLLATHAWIDAWRRPSNIRHNSRRNFGSES